jgi:quercetin dioxygenase-like cupin family protein
MYAFNLDDVLLNEVPMPTGSIRANFPLHSGVGTGSFAAVVFEVDPGEALATHTDSAEEALLVLAGEGEAHVGSETARVRAGDVAVVPAMAPHGIRNTGETTLRVIGFFSSSTVLSTFEHGIGPEGEEVVVWGAARPIFAPLHEPAVAAV